MPDVDVRRPDQPRTSRARRATAALLVPVAAGAIALGEPAGPAHAQPAATSAAAAALAAPAAAPAAALPALGAVGPALGGVSAGGLGSVFVVPQHGTRKGAKRLAKRLLRRYDWNSGSQWRCLNKLWTKESNWNVHADNPTSSAYGIPQALPGRKMGRGWRHSQYVQIRWGLRYIDDRYGTACRAWRHSQRRNWY